MTSKKVRVFRADHCGSFIRPVGLRHARKERYFGRISLKQLRAIEDEAIVDVIALQRDAGIDVVTDGEFRRMFWFSSLYESLRGFSESEKVKMYAKEIGAVDFSENPELRPPFPVVVGRLERDPTKRNLTEEEIQFLKSNAGGPFKITMPSTALLASLTSLYEPGVTDKFYPSRDAMLEHLNSFVEADVRYAAAAGVPYIQLDNPSYTHFMAYERREQLIAKGENPDALLEQMIAADNRLLRLAKSNGARTGVHICLGTYVGTRDETKNRRTQYDPEVTARIFEQVEADTFTCEYSVRSGTMESLRLKPKLGDKVIALGIVNVLEPEVEKVEDVARHIEEAAQYIELRNLAVCSNCGFSGASAAAFIDEDIQRRKLAVIAQAANRVWGTN
jgi:5-methyltetrahydropteroyltriglutamate--homocysteine methyltransferase